MKMEHRKDIILNLLHTYTLSVRHCTPGETQREVLHRLIETTQLTGHKVFEKRDDGRHFIANVKCADGLHRVMTVYNDTVSGKLDVDLTSPIDDELGEEVFVMLYKLLSIAVGITVSELVSHAKKHTSELALAIAERAAKLQL